MDSERDPHLIWTWLFISSSLFRPATDVNFALWVSAFVPYLIPLQCYYPSNPFRYNICGGSFKSRSILLLQLSWIGSQSPEPMHLNLMLISNLAEQTKRQRMELSVIAHYIRKQLGPSESTSEEGASKLPRVILTVGLPGKHQCRCPTCDPKSNQELEAEPQPRGRRIPTHRDLRNTSNGK